MMKYTSPANWDDAPEWANWFAVDGDDGLAFWFEDRPTLEDGNIWTVFRGRADMAGWISSHVLILETRPKNESQDNKVGKFLSELSKFIAAYQD